MELVVAIDAPINTRDDTLIGTPNMDILSMEPRKWIITLHNNYCLTSYSSSYSHSSYVL